MMLFLNKIGPHQLKCGNEREQNTNQLDETPNESTDTKTLSRPNKHKNSNAWDM